MLINDSFVGLVEAMDESRFKWTTNFKTQNRLKLAVFLKLLDFEAEFGRNFVTAGIFRWCTDRTIIAPLGDDWFKGLRQLHPRKVDAYASTVVICPEPTVRNTFPLRY